MTDDRSSRRHRRFEHLGVRRSSEESTASGIYGVIVGAAVMAASHAETALAVAAAVVGTLVIYWGAERYARIVAQRIHEGRRPSWRQVRAQLGSGLDMVTASGVPLAVLLLSKLLGASLSTAVLLGLVASTVLLAVAGWDVGRGGTLSRGERLASAGTAAAFGVAFTALKMILH